MEDLKQKLYKCGRGHTVAAWGVLNMQIDLTGYFCIVCLGAVVDHGDLIDSRLLAQRQEDV